MNSGISCLQNTPLLTNYFLEDKHRNEYNPDNVLASKDCALTKKYSLLLKHLHIGTSDVFAPRKFKRAVGNRNAMFEDFG